MEYAENGSLVSFLHNGPFPLAIAKHLSTQLLSGIKHIHQMGYCHRDLKPENLLLSKEYNLKITDFGLTRLWEQDDGSLELDTRYGSLPYAAPEMFDINKTYHGEAIDIYAFGVIVFELCTGHKPFGQAMLNDVYYKTYKNDTSMYYNLFY